MEPIFHPIHLYCTLWMSLYIYVAAVWFNLFWFEQCGRTEVITSYNYPLAFSPHFFLSSFFLSPFSLFSPLSMWYNLLVIGGTV